MTERTQLPICSSVQTRFASPQDRGQRSHPHLLPKCRKRRTDALLCWHQLYCHSLRVVVLEPPGNAAGWQFHPQCLLGCIHEERSHPPTAPRSSSTPCSISDSFRWCLRALFVVIAAADPSWENLTVSSLWTPWLISGLLMNEEEGRGGSCSIQGPLERCQSLLRCR